VALAEARRAHGHGAHRRVARPGPHVIALPPRRPRLGKQRLRHYDDAVVPAPRPPGAWSLSTTILEREAQGRQTSHHRNFGECTVNIVLPTLPRHARIPKPPASWLPVRLTGFSGLSSLCSTTNVPARSPLTATRPISASPPPAWPFLRQMRCKPGGYLPGLLATYAWKGLTTLSGMRRAVVARFVSAGSRCSAPTRSRRTRSNSFCGLSATFFGHC
jgi:hypothetical protein